MFTMIASILNPVFEALFAFISVISTMLFAVNVNSRSWRKDVANEIFEMVDKNKEKLLKELSSNIRNRCIITADHLQIIVDQLEQLRRSIHLNRQDTRELFFLLFRIIKQSYFVLKIYLKIKTKYFDIY